MFVSEQYQPNNLFAIEGAFRSAQNLAKPYRYGFNGMEKDDEVKGEGNSYTTEFRQYDPRIGRWLSLDPAQSKLPWQSPYVAFNNSPIQFDDPNGDYIDWNVKGKQKRKLKREIRRLKRKDDSFRAMWKEWRKSDEKHTIWSIHHTNTNNPDGAQQNDNYPFIYTNSNHHINNNGKRVKNHHHYIGTPKYSINETEFEVDFKNQSDEVVSDTDPIKEHINENNVLDINVTIGTTSSRSDAKKRVENQGHYENGEVVVGKPLNSLLKARENKIISELEYDGSYDSERIYSGKRGRNDEGVTKVKSTVTVKTIEYEK